MWAEQLVKIRCPSTYSWGWIFPWTFPPLTVLNGGHTFVAVTMLQVNPTSRELKDLFLVTWMQPSDACLFLASIESSPFYLTHMLIPPYFIFIHDFTHSMPCFPPGGDWWAHFYSKQQMSVRGENIKKGIIVQKDQNIQNKNLTKRTLM